MSMFIVSGPLSREVLCDVSIIHDAYYSTWCEGGNSSKTSGEPDTEVCAGARHKPDYNNLVRGNKFLGVE